MKVTPDKMTQDYEKRLQSQQRNALLAKEAELKGLGQRYESQEKVIKQKGAEKLSAQEIKNRQELLDSQARGVKILEKSQAQNEVRKKQLDNEHKSILEQSRLRNQSLALKSSENYIKKIAEVTEINSEINDRVDLKVNEISQKAIEEIDKERFAASAGIQEKQNAIQSKLNKEEAKFSKMVDYQQKEFSNTLQDNRKTQTKILKDTQKNNKMLLDSTQQAQKHQLKSARDFHASKLKQEKETFQKNLDNQVALHKSILDRVKNQFEQEIKKYKADTATDKTTRLGKGSDPFYNVSLLTPRIVETPKKVTLHLEVPEHEMNNLKVSVQQKEINLNFTRRFEDRLESQDGSVNKSRRSEVINKRISLPYHLSDKNITKEYQDNVLTIHINKDA